jgi:hypothetical protein
MKHKMVCSPHTILVLLVILLLAFVACENNPEVEFEPQLNVFAVLTNIVQTQEIIVDRTYSIDEPSEPAIDDAFVILTGNGYTDTLEFSYSSQRYLSAPINLIPQATYELVVEKGGLDTLYGVTTVPGDFAVSYPVGYDTLTLQDTIVFTQSSGAALYNFVFIHYTGGFGPSFMYEPSPLDTLVRVPVGEYLDEHCLGLFTIFIIACDSNFYEYQHVLEDSITQAGVTGGVGLFGSTWTEATSAWVFFE